MLQLNLFSTSSSNFSVPYGENEIVGRYAEANGIKMYYEAYGQGDPLLLIHGNGESISIMMRRLLSCGS